ncbi:MAG TPA: hypothetical protein PKZ93_11800, partial [Spirochaetota bacterium]|nr:hypothetical protein [Spirochaetota bacterium]
MVKPSQENEKILEEILNIDPQEAKPKSETVGEPQGIKTKESEINFNILPEELEEYLNKYVIGQEEAI